MAKAWIEPPSGPLVPWMVQTDFAPVYYDWYFPDTDSWTYGFDPLDE